MVYIYGVPFILKGTKVLLQISYAPLLIIGPNHSPQHYDILLEVRNDGLTGRHLRNILKVSYLTGTVKAIEPTEDSVLGITGIWFSYLRSCQKRGTASCIKDLHVNAEPPFQGQEGWSHDTVARLWLLAFQQLKQIHHSKSASPSPDGPSIMGEALTPSSLRNVWLAGFSITWNANHAHPQVKSWVFPWQTLRHVWTLNLGGRCRNARIHHRDPS